MDSFFNKNGTLQGLMQFANDYKDNKDAQQITNSFKGTKSENAFDRLDSMVKLITSIVAMI